MASNKLHILNEFPTKIPSNKLPSNADIIKAIQFEKESANISTEAAVKIVANQVNELWQRAQIPVVGERRVNRQLIEYFEDYLKLYRSDSNRKSYDAKVAKFKVIIYSCRVECEENTFYTFSCIEPIVIFSWNQKSYSISHDANAQIFDDVNVPMMQKCQ